MDEFNWTECAVIAENGYRPLIDEAPDYCIGPAMNVWRLPTLRPGKGGSSRLLKAHEVTLDNGQVPLRRDGKTYRHSVAKLHRKYHPERYRFGGSILPETLVPEGLRCWWDLMREKPARTPWGAGDHSPGVHGFRAAEVFRPAIHIPSALYVRWTSDRLSRGNPAAHKGQDRLGEERLVART